MKKYIVAAFLTAVSFGLIPNISFAETVTDTLDGATGSSCVALSYGMSMGSKDSRTNGQVSDLQLFLQDKGYLASDPTGFFGAMTKKAVQSFQAANAITSNGLVGPYTRAKIQALSCGTSDSTVTMPSNTTPNTNTAGSASSEVPAISTVSKGTAAVGKSVILYGSNFGGSYISWGGANGFTLIPTRISSNGNEIEFTVPDVSPGTYDVSVNKKANTAVYVRQNTTHFTVASRDLDPTTVSSSFQTSLDSYNQSGNVKVKISQSKESTSAGEPFTVSWISENATSCTYETSSTNINGGTWQTEGRDLSGSKSYNYVLAAIHQSRVTCVGSSGTAPAIATITHKITYDQPSSPFCSITTDKYSYVYGDTIKISYTSTNATYTTWVPDTSGKDNFVLGGDKLNPSGYAEIVANRVGNPFVTLKAVNASGQSATCTKIIPVSLPTTIQTVPSITRVEFTNSDGLVGQVKIIGINFSATSNTVNISGKTGVVPSSNSGTIINIPFSSSVASTYQVTVTTSAGTSNTASFSTPGVSTLTMPAPPSTTVQVPSATMGLSFYTSVGKNDTFSMSWYGTNSPTSYNVKIDNTVLPKGTVTTWSGTPADLGLAAGSHTFSSQACNSAGCGEWSAVVTRTVTEPVSITPVLPSPSTTPTTSSALPAPSFSAACSRMPNGTYIVGVVWGLVPGAVNYPLRLVDPSGKETDLGMGAVGDSAPTGSPYTFTGLASAGTYSYWGHAWNTSGWSAASSGSVTCSATSYVPQESNLAVSSASSFVLGASAQCVDLPYNMFRGYESQSVTTLQNFLKSRNFLDETTGFYGDKTVAAVNAYQASKGLPQTGMVYDFTRIAIKEDSCQ